MQDTGCEMWDARCDNGMQGLGCRTHRLQAAGWLQNQCCRMFCRMQNKGYRVQAVSYRLQEEA